MNVCNVFEVNTLESFTKEYLNLLKYSIVRILKNQLPFKLCILNLNTVVYFLQHLVKIYPSKSSTLQENTIQKLTPYFTIKLPIMYTYAGKSIVKYTTILKLPKIDTQGNFIFNGRKKGFISSLKKRTGVYFTAISKSEQLTPIAHIFLTKFLRLNLEITETNVFLYTFSNSKLKLDLIQLLHFLGLTNKDIVSFSRYGSSFFMKNILYKTMILYEKQELFTNINTKKITSFLYFIHLMDIEYNLKFLNNLKDTYFNLKLQNKHKLITYHKKLIAFDLINIIDILIDLKVQKRTYSNLDNFNYKYIQTPGLLLNTLISNLLETSLYKNKELKYNFLSSNTTLQLTFKNIQNIFKFKPLYSTIKDFLAINPLVQYLEQINSLSELMHKVRINSFLSTNQNNSTRIGINIREIKPSYLGKICLLHTSEGINSGLILSTTSTSKLSINNNLISLLKNKSTNSFSKILYKKNFLDESSPIFLNTSFYRKNQIFKQYNAASILKNEIASTRVHNPKELLSTSLFSYAENLIPFLYHDDPARGLMGARMLLQALPLIYRQKSYTITGAEFSIFENSSTILRSHSEGVISYVSNFKIILRDIFNRQVIYYLQKYKKTNQGNIINQSPLVWVGERILPGQLLAHNYDMLNNELVLGNNLSVIYGGYYGNEHEDALIINKKVANRHLFTSLHFDIYESSLHFRNRSFPEYSTILLPKTSFYIKRNLDSFGIIKEGSFCLDKDILISKILVNNIIKLSSSIYNLVFSLFGQHLRNIQNCSVYSTPGTSGRVVKVEVSIPTKQLQKTQEYLNIRLFICNQRLLSIGDKLTGKHGNKGVIASFVEDIDLPYNDTYLIPDIILGSLSAPSRMNLGQLFESMFGVYGVLKNKHLLLNTTLLNSNASIKKNLLYSQLNLLKVNLGNIFGYNPYSVGKYNMRDGIFGTKFKNTLFVGNSHFFKLIHMIKDKYHSRTIGLYTELTQEPVKGRSKGGGQRFGEMEVWALEAYGASYNLKEILTYKSNDIEGRSSLYKYILGGYKLMPPTTTETFRLIVRELNGIAINLSSFVCPDLNTGDYLDTNINF